MNPSNATKLISAAITHRQPVLLTGAPGVGKTAIVSAAASSNGCELMVSHPVVADPTDFRGLPWPDATTNKARFLPYGDLQRAVSAEKPLIWLLDDLGQAAPAVQAACMQLLLARHIDGQPISPNVTILAASNRRTDRAGVSGMLEPVKSRFTTIIEIEPDLGDWCEWALTHSIPAVLIAFLRYRPDLLSDFKPTADFTQSPSPRTWENAARVEAWGLPLEVEAAAMAGAVGDGAATEYLAFRQMAAALVTADAILLDPANAPIPDTPSELFATATSLAARANHRNFDRVVTYCERLLGAAKGEFAALCIRDSVRRSKDIQTSDGFTKAVCGPIGKLISGTL